MIRRVTPVGHALVGLSVVAMTALAGFGVIGAGHQALFRPEHFDAKTGHGATRGSRWPFGSVKSSTSTSDSLNVAATSAISQTTLVRPSSIAAFSPDANGEVTSSNFGSRTQIRIGNAGVFFTGQHRYELEYTLPAADVSNGVLAVDIIGTDETFTTDRFEVVLTGFVLDNVRCDTGGLGQFGGCDFTKSESGDYIAVIEPLNPGEGITVGGTIVATARDQL